MVRIIVCMKQVTDPEAPVSSFRLDSGAKRALPPPGVPPVLSPFDENALEVALKIKDSQPAMVTVLSMGPRLARPVVRKALAAGADELVLLEDPRFDSFDSFFTAAILAWAIRRIGNYDMILCGREAADTHGGQVGIGIAELLGVPVVTLARRVDVVDGRVRVITVLPDGYAVVESRLPVLITVSSEAGELRRPSVVAITSARKKPVTVWGRSELGSLWPEERTSLSRMFVPSHEVSTELIAGETPQQAGARLALRLRDSGLI